MHAGALPLSQQILLDIFFPPVGALMWWLMSLAGPPQYRAVE